MDDRLSRVLKAMSVHSFFFFTCYDCFHDVVFNDEMGCWHYWDFVEEASK